MTSYKVLCKLLTTRFKKSKLNGSLIALACLASYYLGDGSLANQIGGSSAKILVVLLVRVRNMKNRISKNSSMKIPVHYTCRGKLKTKIVAHKILPLKSCSSLKFPQTVISIIFLYLTEKQPSEILRFLLEIQTRWFDVCCTVKY